MEIQENTKCKMEQYEQFGNRDLVIKDRKGESSEARLSLMDNYELTEF